MKLRSGKTYTTKGSVTVKKAKKPKVSAVVKTYVKKAISSNLENKNNFLYNSSPEIMWNYTNNSASFIADNCFLLIPGGAPGLSGNFITIAQSVGQGGRIGNKVTVKKYTFSAVIYPVPYTATETPAPYPQDVRVMIFKMRGNNAISTELSSDFFQDGGSGYGLGGRLQDMVSKPNLDTKIMYRDFMIKVGPAIQSTAAGGSVVNYLGSNNDYKFNQVVKIDLSKYVPKHFLFDDTSGAATADQVYLVFQPVNADGSVAPAALDYQLNYYWNLSLDYEDA